MKRETKNSAIRQTTLEMRGLLPENEICELDTDGISSTADANGLEHTGVSQLIENKLVLECAGALGFVGFDTSHEVRLALKA
jgi:hypothetical protein